MLTNKIFNASALESLLCVICAFLQIYLCLLANVFLLSIKCMFVCYQIYSHFIFMLPFSESYPTRQKYLLLFRKAVW